LGRLGAFQERCQERSMKAPFFEDVSSEIAIFGPQEGVLNLLSTGRKAPLFLRGCGIAFLFVIPALPPPLPLALLASYSFYPLSVRCSSACLSLLALMGVILDAFWSVLGVSWAVLRPSENSLERPWAVSEPLGPS